jgi:hypothetical protein
MNVSDSTEPDSTSLWQRPWLIHAGVALLILISSVALYRQFLQDAPMLWSTSSHDRNGHYLRSQEFAHALRPFSPRSLINQLHMATVWPPFHPLVTGIFLTVTKVDYRLAVLPSLAAWAATCWLVFLLARRLAPLHGELAGMVALLFTIASPAYRAFAVDIMIESMGAALTLATLYFYVSTLQDRSVWRGRCFALCLLALCLTKYNYWLLVVQGLMLHTLWAHRVFLRDAVQRWYRSGGFKHELIVQLSHPMTYLLIPAFALAGYVQLIGRATFTLTGHVVNIDSMSVPGSLCFVLVLLRVLPWWRRSGRHTAAKLDVPGPQLVHWLIYPLSVWFLWPKKVGIFIWSVTCTQHGRKGPYSPWIGNLNYYWDWLREDYHANLAALVLVLVLIVLAYLGWRRCAKGSSVVFVFLAVAALLTNYHSANRSRFLHSWLAAGWVVAGVGAALAWESIASRARAFSLPNRRRVAAAAPIAALIGLAGLQGRSLVSPGHAEEGGTTAYTPSLLPLVDKLKPSLASAQHPVLVCGEPFELLLDWRLGESRNPWHKLRVPPRELLAPGTDHQLDDWVQHNAGDVLVVVEFPHAPFWVFCPGFEVEKLRAYLRSSSEFVLESEWPFQAGGVGSAQLWRHTSPVTACCTDRRPAPPRPPTEDAASARRHGSTDAVRRDSRTATGSDSGSNP